MPDSIKRIFIIGPMGSSGEPLHNIVEIRAVLDKILKSFPEKKCEVTIPQEQYGSHIPTRVFEAIDMSDLIVADISARSPCVIYELAFAHALGIATILVDDQRNYNAGLEPIFYLNQSDTLRLTSRSSQELQQGLFPQIRSWLYPSKASLPVNPMTSFYEGVALVDASAVTGIAVGYIENFLNPVMQAVHDTENHFEQPDGINPPVAVVVVVPENIDNVSFFEKEVRERLKREFPDLVSFPRLVVSPDRKDARSVMYVGGLAGVVVDVPRTVFPLRRSPRVSRLSANDAEEMERKLLANFVTVLTERTRRLGVPRDHLHVVTFEELAGTVGRIIFST